MKFRKKPVVIEAVQLKQAMEVPDWFGDKVLFWGTNELYAVIHNLEGKNKLKGQP